MWLRGHSLKGKRSKSSKAQESKRLRVWPRLFKLATGERLYTFEAALAPNPRFPRIIESVAFDGKGTRLAAAYAEGEFSIWDTSALLQ